MNTPQAQNAAKVRSWAADEYENGARLQAESTSRARGVIGVAIMPDAHVGLGACIGTVVATRGTILPAAVGVDLGCGMTAAQLSVTEDQLPDTLNDVLAAFGSSVPAVQHNEQRRPSRPRAEALRWLRQNPAPSGRADMDRAAAQMGTLGSGNHFLEMSVDDAGGVWIVIHSGSRGVGNWLARQHIKTAQTIDTAAENRDLAALTAGTNEFDEYVADMLWAQAYAHHNRDAALGAAVNAFGKCTGLPTTVIDTVRCHHNYAELETHDRHEMWITRKGAIRAQVGDRGIIPGSMGTSTFIVRGLGQPASYCSAAHGAGRAMSRSKARENITGTELAEAMSGRTWQADQASALVDEAPGAYKDIGKVMALQADLCEPIAELSALVNYKGT